jgi:predicted methyltransferase
LARKDNAEAEENMRNPATAASRIAIIIGAAVIATMLGGARVRAQSNPAGTAGTVKAESAIPAANIPKAITDAVNSPARPASDRAMDASRKPDQVMAFYDIRPGMRVADLWAGGGYTTELLALIVGPQGKVYSQNPPPSAKFQKTADAWQARLKQPALANVVPISQPFSAPNVLKGVPPNSLDAVFINLNYHDVIGMGFSTSTLNEAVFKSLKPGGEYCIVDNSAKNGTGIRDVSTIHRVDINYVIKEVERSGFHLTATSDVLRNPKDDRTLPFWKMNHQQDRFMLKFVKPDRIASE